MRKLCLRSLLLVSLTISTISSAATSEQNREVATCAAIEDSVKRLECFDALAKELGVDAPKVAVSQSGVWEVQTEKSPIDDSTNVFVSIHADEPISTRLSFGKPRPQLIVACREGKTSIVLDWGVYISTQPTPMALRVDKEKATTQTWELATNYEAVGLWQSGVSVKFIKSLFGKNELFVRITPYGESAVSSRFAIGGLEEALTPLRSACRWEERQKIDTSRKAAAPQQQTKSSSQLAVPMRPQLTTSEIDVVKAQIGRCWNPPAGAKEAHDLIVEISAVVAQDGRVISAQITSTARMGDPLYRAAAESVLRAVLNPQCLPLKLPPEKYEQWKTLDLTFDPKDLL